MTPRLEDRIWKVMKISDDQMSLLCWTRNVFKKKTGRRIMDGIFYYRLIEISYNSDRPNNILSNKVKNG